MKASRGTRWMVIAVLLLAGGAISCGPDAEPTTGATEAAVVETITATEPALAATSPVPPSTYTPPPAGSPTPTSTHTPAPQPASTLAPTPTDSPTPTPTLPPVVGPEPSHRIAAFYYPWYRTLASDGAWDHWGEGQFHPPLDVASDYYPLLGAYSNLDPAVVARHFAWLREAGVGVIVSSWWGRMSIEEKAVPLLLDMGERYGIRVAFHLEPYGGRTADRMVSDVRYLYDNYGGHPAFYRTTARSRWSPDDRAKGLFFLWASIVPDTDSPPVEPGYWREALDTIHALPDGGLVLSDQTVSDWVDGGHFDGLYSYAALQLDGSYTWARGLPPGAWYVPGVNPGFSAVRIRYPEDTFVPRRDGASYDERWAAALDVGVEPALIAVTSFNEWHEGTQIEPAAVGATNGRGYTYADYSPLPPDGYLALTRRWVDRVAAMSWPAATRVRIRMVTTSDWTTLGLIGGATWLRPGLVSASGEALDARMEGDRLFLTQPLARAEAGGVVDMTVDLLFSGLEAGGTLVFEIERGHLGFTQVELFNYVGPEPVAAHAFTWGNINPGERNAATFQVPAEALLNARP